MSREENAIVDDEWWLEYLEGELEAEQRQNLTQTLGESLVARKTVRELVETRQAIRDSDLVSLPESGYYYAALHWRIMQGILADEAEIRSVEAMDSCQNLGLPVWPLR
jgi:hypothetical protein